MALPLSATRRYDFTGSGPYLMAALLIFIVFFMIAGIWLRFNKVYVDLSTSLSLSLSPSHESWTDSANGDLTLTLSLSLCVLCSHHQV